MPRSGLRENASSHDAFDVGQYVATQCQGLYHLCEAGHISVVSCFASDVGSCHLGTCADWRVCTYSARALPPGTPASSSLSDRPARMSPGRGTAKAPMVSTCFVPWTPQLTLQTMRFCRKPAAPEAVPGIAVIESPCHIMRPILDPVGATAKTAGEVGAPHPAPAEAQP